MRNNSTTDKILVVTVTVLVALQIGLVAGSWIVAAAFPNLSIHSLLSSEGIRWLLGHAADNLCTPYFIWLLMICVAAGCLQKSGLLHVRKYYRTDFRTRYAVRLVVVELAVLLSIMLMLTLLPHAILLSVTGNLFSGAFPRCIVPVLCAMVIMAALSFGLVSGILHTVSDVAQCLAYGLSKEAPWLLCAMLIIQLVKSALFICQP